MMNARRGRLIAPAMLLIALAAFFSFGLGGEHAGTIERRKLVLQSVVQTIRDGHFSPRELNDEFSERVYDKVFNILDHDKRFFTQKDMDALARYRHAIDEELKAGACEFFKAVEEAYAKRIDTVDGFDDEMLGKPLVFTGDEQVPLNGEKIPYAADEQALAARWRAYLRYRVLAKYVELKDEQEKKEKDAPPAAKKTDAQLEQDARAAILKNQTHYIKRLRGLDEEERFALYVNCIAGSVDPHTTYLPPKLKQRFDESMKGSFFGIGAQLRDEDGEIKVMSIIAGSPCWKQGELKAGDEIIKVAQGASEAVDIQGFDIEDAVQLIRGKKGTEVRLTVKKPDGTTKVIPIVRGEVLMEDTFAKSAIISGEDGPVGYISLPEFYADFNNPRGRHCAKDVAVEVKKLVNAGVKGIVIDLRNNGGGSLADVVEMVGLFIDMGPVVQVRDGQAAPQTMRDPARGVLYAGPLAILVNQASASASEIMAAALQDYRRAIVIGSPTHGKGTVQKLLSLDDGLSSSERQAALKSGAITPEKPIGTLKLTVQKFYRINGGSTQLRGVTPDIVLPNPYQFADTGERRDKAALPWDEIPAAAYKAAANPVDVTRLVEASGKRTSASPEWKLIEESARRMHRLQEENARPINEAAYRKEMDESNAASKRLEELEAKRKPLTVTNPREDQPKINIGEDAVAKNNDWLKTLAKDLTIVEAFNVIRDMNNPAGPAGKDKEF